MGEPLKQKHAYRLQIAGLIVLGLVTIVVVVMALQQPGPTGILPGITNPLKK
jgi:hypothetical protein